MPKLYFYVRGSHFVNYNYFIIIIIVNGWLLVYWILLPHAAAQMVIF